MPLTTDKAKVRRIGNYLENAGRKARQLRYLVGGGINITVTVTYKDTTKGVSVGEEEDAVCEEADAELMYARFCVCGWDCGGKRIQINLLWL